jgi:hypothetical protein
VEEPPDSICVIASTYAAGPDGAAVRNNAAILSGGAIRDAAAIPNIDAIHDAAAVRDAGGIFVSSSGESSAFVVNVT